MPDTPWTPYDPEWPDLTAQQRRIWTPEQVDLYDTYTWRNRARATPADFARCVSPEWIDLPHITYISGIIAQFVHGTLINPRTGKPYRKLFLTMPPRHGKSFLLSKHVPAWYLTLYPQRHVILTTYEGDFAASWGGAGRDIMQAHGGKFGLSVRNDSKAKQWWNLSSPHRGGMITAGKGGPITGKGGGLLVGDDWIKDWGEAKSPTQRDNDWNWYTSTFSTRAQKDLQDPLAPPPLQLLLMTRWNEDDVMGRILRLAASTDAQDVCVIHLPALAMDNDPLGREPGQALCPQIMDEEEAADQKALDPGTFQALFQGDPTPEEGGLFSKSQFRKWRYANTDRTGGAYMLQTPEGTLKPVKVEDCRHFITSDWAITEKKSADYTVFGLYALTPDRDLLLVSQFRDRIEEAKHIPSLQRFYDEGQSASGNPKVRLVGVEKQSFGLSVLANGRRTTSMPLRELKADLDKFARALPAASLVSGGQFYLPEHASWAEEFISECTSFPNGAHDDQVDTFAYAARVCEQFFPGFKAPKDERGGEDSRIDDHVSKIAKRNAKERSKRRGAYRL